MNAVVPPIILSSHDVRRIERLLEKTGPQFRDTVAALEHELTRAEVRTPQDMPADVVTMHSRVLCADETTGAEHVLQLVYPPDADVSAGKVSILAPVGAALLGLSVGQTIEWPLPGGRLTRLRVMHVLDQPEANGRLD